MKLFFEMTIVDPLGAMWNRILVAMEERGLTLFAPSVGSICRLGDEEDGDVYADDDSWQLIGAHLPTTYEWLDRAYASGRRVSVCFWTSDGDTPLNVHWDRVLGRSGPVYTFRGSIRSGDLIERYQLAAFFLDLLGRYQASVGKDYQCEFRVFQE